MLVKGGPALEPLLLSLACGIDVIHALKHFSSNGFNTGRDLGDRLHSVNLDMTSDNNSKLLVMPCFEFLSPLHTGCLEQK